jgi:uncharacterized protein (TIGR03435 family)
MNFMVRVGRTLPIMLFLMATALLVRGQKSDDSASPRPFEVASIKPSKPGAVMQDMRIAFPPGRMEAVNVTLNELLLSFSGFSGHVKGGPKWVDQDRYDIVAKADGEIMPDERGPMLTGLLELRFKLTTHHESKDESGIALVKGVRALGLEAARDGEPTTIHLDEHRQVIFKHVSMARLASYLHSMWGIPVVDRTVIPGAFDFTLAPDKFAADSPDFADRIRPALEALGFKLEPVKVPVDITIIDNVERPSEN